MDLPSEWLPFIVSRYRPCAVCRSGSGTLYLSIRFTTEAAFFFVTASLVYFDFLVDDCIPGCLSGSIHNAPAPFIRGNLPKLIRASLPTLSVVRRFVPAAFRAGG